MGLGLPHDMRSLARSVIFAVQFLELSDDSVVDPSDAVTAMESIADELSRSTAEEREALRSALAELIDQNASLPMTDASRVRLQFYTDFMTSFGLDETEEDDPA